MAYTTLLLDFDHTLFDSDTSEKEAFAAALYGCGVAETAKHYATYKQINRTLWSAAERGEIDVNALHTMRFERLAEALQLAAPPARLADEYAHAMGVHGDLYPDAHEVLDKLASSARLALVTNGLGTIQRARLERLGIVDHFESVVISTEVGASKPGGRIFEIAFEQMRRPTKESTLMVGDSLASDIRGGRDFGIATCWYNPSGNDLPKDETITHQIKALDQLPDLVARRRA